VFCGDMPLQKAGGMARSIIYFNFAHGFLFCATAVFPFLFDNFKLEHFFEIFKTIFTNPVAVIKRAVCQPTGGINSFPTKFTMVMIPAFLWTLPWD
jgi:hypothetical protein